MRKFHPKRALLIGVLLLSATLLTLAFLIAPRFGLSLAIVMVVFFGVAYGTYQTEYFAVAMRFVDPRIAASMFAILMAFTNIGQGIGMYLSGTLADRTGFSNTFLILFGINLLILPMVYLIFNKKEKVSNII